MGGEMNTMFASKIWKIFLISVVAILLFPPLNGWAFSTNSLNPIDESPIYLPLVYRRGSLPEGISGCVTENGFKVAGVSINLNFFDGSTSSTLATQVTDTAGYYNFKNLNSLGQNQTYQVVFQQNYPTYDPNRLSVWSTKKVISYTIGSASIWVVLI
jgi:hypothetical protein